MAKTTSWQRIKEIPPLLASVVAVVAAIVGVVTWIDVHFATRRYVEELHCLTLTNNSLNSRQIEQTVSLQRQQELSAKIRFLEAKERTPEPLTLFEEESLRQDREEYMEFGEAFSAAETEAKRLVAILKSGDLFDASGKCKGAQELERHS